ncbi:MULTISPECIES: transglutaminase family protein [Marivita]|uniref:Transglutaminase family protein n=1 Tax=Marivita cryptomonadis TaxID=505252 RepID=A0A9Q2NYY3_9RHOB|nr:MULTISPECIES: transglutaminase family protein [Marivita]MCR9168821.1 transglutaminase family protein [Paracoccaceae bacterium]MBM2323467.1 transglutaminase family protein [Marivita cryptomonadis]MBM2333053.1 transglutaminase family protein [Marivita cryptomonadis]MBM2342633.1 transglutaminase family protein [Marivita cryptomonadis]MBM2347301.1 transglutaminase family protein [Marivita cryptomonadis]
MKYSIRLTIAHYYDLPAANSRHLIRVLPRTLLGRQKLTTHLLEVFPEPESKAEGVDFFGNTTHSCAHRDQHKEMSIRLSCHVEMDAPSLWQDLSPSIQRLRSDHDTLTDLGPTSPLHFLGPSPRLPPNSAIRDFAKDLYQPEASAVETVIRIGKALHETMTFDATATTVDTDAADAFRLQRGVCQDFTHIMILALQSLGIPSGYVSGYLRTLPPPGSVKLEGADAMHAWVRAWCGPLQGWIEYDPTNATLVGTDHVVAGYGRDYSDVAPVRGHLRSSGGQSNTQAVDVAIAG